MDRLWSPWRLEYITRGPIDASGASACVFCAALTDPEPQSLIVFRGTACYVILNRYPYNNGHLMVVPIRHVGTLGSLTSAELEEIAHLTERSEAALGEAYIPQGFNVGINLGRSAGAGILEHLHVHIVPRWSGDSNFMTVIGETRVLPEELSMSVARLRPIFARLTQREPNPSPSRLS
jgi:ATP adenylyltransferase